MKEHLLNIAAIGDVHSPKYLNLYKNLVSSVDWSKINILIFAGDMIFKGSVNEYSHVINITRKYFDGKILAVFGNEEYETLEEKIISNYSDEIEWLRDTGIMFTVDGFKIGIIGTRGILDRPTFWQRKNIPNIREKYSQRLRKLENVVSTFRKKCDLIILVSHYSVTYKTLKGEREKTWPELGSTRMEKLLKKYGVEIAIHAHAHRSKVTMTRINGTSIYNVSLLATGKITTIKIKKPSRGLLDFFQ